ncbi:hypothetical protein ACHAPU_009818 [Fusarium lateritium]
MFHTSDAAMMLSSENRDSIPLGETPMFIDDEHDPVLIKFKELKELARRSYERRAATKALHHSAHSDVSSSPSDDQCSVSSTTSEATAYSDEAKLFKSESNRTVGWQISPQAQWDERVPAFSQPIPTTEWLGRPWRDGCHPSVHRQQ